MASPRGILKKEGNAPKPKASIHFRNGANNVLEFNKWATPENFLNRTTEFGNETFAPLGNYTRFSRRQIAQAASAEPDRVLSQLQIVGFHRVKPRSSSSSSNNDEGEVKAEVCNMATGVCWLMAISSIAAGYLLGKMGGGGKRKTRRYRQGKKHTRKLHRK
jgi:hypothetical protein